MTGALFALASAAGIALRYRDVTGTLRETGPETARALLRAMGLGCATEAEAAETLAELTARDRGRHLPEWLVLEPGRPVELELRRPAGAWALSLEDGQGFEGLAGQTLALPPLPVGSHSLRIGGQSCTLLVAPRSLALPARGWGVTLPLYGLRTEAQGGFGDYRDLAEAVAGLGACGAGFVGINPIHAGFPTDPDCFSPYTPSSRRRLNVLHIAVPGAGGACTPLIDYGRDIPRKLAALEAHFAEQGPAALAGLEAYRRREGEALERFALHQALSERFGPYWRDWPERYRSPGSPAVAAFAREQAGNIRFHAWLQFTAERQLAEVARAAGAAGMAHGLCLDMAAGTHPAGAESWAHRQSFVRGVQLGAPPDAFAVEGQAWGLAPLDPRMLAAEGFRLLAEALRAQFRFVKMLRIDHILGFQQAFWVPEGGDLPGTYVAMPKAALLAVVRIEAARAGATVIGEDLGNVPEGLRGDLARSGILGCRLAMFERDGRSPPRFRRGEDYDPITLASFSTHDLPTWRGWRQGRDIGWWRRLGRIGAAAEAAARQRRADEVAAFDARSGGQGEGTEALHRFLAGTASRLAALQIENVLGMEEQANLPGTLGEHPNWRRRLPVAASALAEDPEIRQAARLMSR